MTGTELRDGSEHQFAGVSKSCRLLLLASLHWRHCYLAGELTYTYTSLNTVSILRQITELYMWLTTVASTSNSLASLRADDILAGLNCMPAPCSCPQSILVYMPS